MANIPSKPPSNPGVPQNNSRTPDIKKPPIVPPVTRTVPKAELDIIKTYFGERHNIKVLEAQLQSATKLKELATLVAEDLERSEKERKIWSDQITTIENIENSNKIINSLKHRYTKILIKHAEAAFDRNYDLNISSWRQHLIGILSDPRIIYMSPVVSSAQTSEGVAYKKILVEINLSAYAGTVDDYIDAVRYARKVLAYGNQFKGSIGTRMWYSRLWLSGRTPGGHYRLGVFDRTTKSKYYITKDGKKKAVPITLESKRIGSKPNDRKEQKHSELYWDIMNARMEFMKKKAPYWYILNYGSTSMKGDQGGYAAPPIVPTYFLEKAIDEISVEAYKDIEKVLEAKAKNARTMLELFEKGAYPKIKKAAEAMYTIVLELTGGGIYKTSYDIAINYLKQAWAPILSQLESDKIAQRLAIEKMELLVNKIIADIEINNKMYLVSSKGREYKRNTINLVRQIRAEILSKTRTQRAPEATILEARKKVEEIELRIRTFQEASRRGVNFRGATGARK